MEADEDNAEVLGCLSAADRRTVETVLYPGARGHWASDVLYASSEYGHGWVKENLVGPPRAPADTSGWQGTGTWAPAAARGGREVLVLAFPEVLHCTNVLVVEACEPGHVVRVAVPVRASRTPREPAPLFDVYRQPLAARVAAGTMPPRARRVFVVPALASPHAGAVLVLELDTRGAAAWVELAAVALFGVPALALLPRVAAFYPPALLARARLLACARPRLPWHVRAAVVLALYRAWVPARADHDARELAVARAVCGPCTRRRAWLCRGTARGCTGGAVCGSGVCAPGSSLCRAAVHAGAISARAGGLFRIAPAAPACHASPPSCAHGVSALPFASCPAASGSAFVIVPYSKNSSSNEGSNGNEGEGEACGHKGGVWYCCGARHGCRGGTVWGTRLYAAHSSPCRAALHAGAVTPDGGLFLFVRAARGCTATHFDGSVGAWGVQSLPCDDGPHPIAVVLPVLLNSVVAGTVADPQPFATQCE